MCLFRYVVSLPPNMFVFLGVYVSFLFCSLLYQRGGSVCNVKKVFWIRDAGDFFGVMGVLWVFVYKK